MKHLILTSAILLLVSVLAAQEESLDFDYMDVERDSTVFRTDLNKQTERKLQTGVDVSMGYLFSSGGYGGPQFSLSPHVMYPLNDKFSVSAGLSVGYGSFYNPYYGLPGENAMLPMTRMFLYVSGNYHVNEKLMVSGSVYKQINDVPNPNPDSQIDQNFDSHGMSVGFQYKLTPNISFGAQFNFEENGLYGPYSPVMNPYGRMGTGWW